jgi:hypothetical protein
MPPTPTIPDQRQKEEITMKKITGWFTRIAALDSAIAGLVAVTGCGERGPHAAVISAV